MTAAVLALQRRTLRSLRRHRNFRLFFAGQVVSLAGTWMQNVALAWLAVELSGGSAMAVAALAFFRFVPFTLFGLVAGALADRLDTWRLVVATQTAAMGVSAILAAAVLGGVATLPLVYVLAALGGIALVFDAPGRHSLVYQMVGPASLPNAVALNSGLFNAARVLGPALAGVTIAGLNVGACFVINTVSFVAVLVSLWLMRRDELVAVDKQPDGSLIAGVREGVVFVRGVRELRAALGLVVATSVLGFNFHVVIPLLASQTLGVGPRAFGLLSAAFGLGALTGALGTAAFGRASWRVFLGGAAGFAVGLVLLAPVHDAWLAGALLFGVGAAFTLFTASGSAIVQLASPGHLRGRMIALYLFAFVGLAPVGSLLTGWLVEVGGTALAFSAAGLTGTVAVVAAARARRVAVA